MPTPRVPGQVTIMGESAAAASGRAGDQWLHLRALGLGGTQAAGNLVSGTKEANQIMLIFERGLMRGVRNGFSVETAPAAMVRQGTSIGETLRYEAWINGQQVLDTTLDLNTAEKITTEFRDWWFRSGR